MLCRKLRQALITKPALKHNSHYSSFVYYGVFPKKCIIFNSLLAAVTKSESLISMSSFRLILRDLSVRRLWSNWSRSFLANTVIKRIKRDRSVREVFQCFRQAVLRPGRTLLLSTAAFNVNEEASDKPPTCEQSITDTELEALVTELELVEELSKVTLFCIGCGKRIVIDKKQPGVRYCVCKDAHTPQESFDGWLPYMEAEDVIIWRKEYKPGQGLYAYKVYGRYRDVRAEDFAAVQVDGAYRRVWDAAVAALSVVERHAQGVVDQAVLHWEVLWPRLFANRDYVYIRRHKDFDVTGSVPLPHKEGLFESPPSVNHPPVEEERPSVHSHAKRKAIENDLRQKVNGGALENKVFVIISRSCEHPEVPESKNAIRVSEYWSHMVVKSLNGVDKPGMEFVLTYYDEPAVGGLPSGVAAWATGRAAPAYLERMRRAAHDYDKWRSVRSNQELPDFVSFNQSKTKPSPGFKVSEQDMESSKDGPELENAGAEQKRDQSTQTEQIQSIDNNAAIDKTVVVIVQNEVVKVDKVNSTSTMDTEVKQNVKENFIKIHSTPSVDAEVKQEEKPVEAENDKPEEENGNTGYWWRNEEDVIFLLT